MGAGHSMENSLETFTNKEYLLESIVPMLELRRRIGNGEQQTGQRRPINAKYKPKDVTLNPKNRIGISDLEAEETLVGMYLLCRTIAPPFQMTAICLIVEDPEGENAVRLCIYEFHENDNRKPSLEEIFPVGTLLAVRNPWFKRNVDGGYSVRVEGEGSIQILSENSFKKNFPGLQWQSGQPKAQKNPTDKKGEEKKTSKNSAATDWKIKGNKYFASQDYEKAYECYAEGLKTEPNNVDILSNRAATAIHLSYFHKALEDSEKLLNIKADHTKGIYRKAKALAGLERYEDAIKFLENKMTQIPDLKKAEEFKSLVFSLRKLVKERSSGNYDFLSLYSGDHFDCCEDVADFQGPVEIANIENKGRGLVATKDIPAGTLLIVCKAFAVVYEEDVESQLLMLNTNQHAVFKKALVANIMEKLKVEPELGKKLLDLHPGEDFLDENDDNSLDMQKVVRAVCHYNAVSGKRVAAKNLLYYLWENYFQDKEDDEDDQNSLGLWIYPSYINHSCWDANCSKMTFGNIMIVRSHKDIAKGQEILLSYIAPTETLYQREKFCQNLGFVCCCTICKMERSVSRVFINERKNAFNRIKFCVDNTFLLSSQISRLECLSWSSKNEDNEALNTTMLFALERIAFVHLKKFNFDSAAEFYIKAYTLAKETPLILLTIQYAIQVVAALLFAKKKKLARRWRNVLERHVAIAFGPKPKEVLKLLAEETPLFADSEFWEKFEEIRDIVTS